MPPALPRIFLLPTRLPPEQVRHLEAAVPSVTHDAHEADVLVGNITKRARALFELRRLKLQTAGAKVVRLAWLTDSLARDCALPVDDYLVFEGREASSEVAVPVPDLPSYYLHTRYACERPSPRDPPNEGFIKELEDVRTLRVLQGDSVGLRAYSTAIAALAAYPYPIRTAHEVTRLPGCSGKIAELYQQWAATGRTREMREADRDARMAVLRRFYDIWGVGAATARDFYNKGWRELDDVVKHGWHKLSRAQQIGVKFYEEFDVAIPRAEVEAIAGTILERARRIDAGFEMMIVGGHRRGKPASSDVDVVLSHRDAGRTLGAIEPLVGALEDDGHVTHVLALSTQGSERAQVPAASGSGSGSGNTGFDTLDKALVVWREAEGEPHRRVDVVVSPWRTVGCAVLGWTGATTFERDLRRYCKEEKGLRFDSSGIRGRDGAWVDVEGDGGAAADMEEAERRVFAALGLAWREPTERCTG